MDPIITPAIFLLGLLAIRSKTSGNPGGLGEKKSDAHVPAEDAGPEEIEFSPEWRHAALDVRASKSGALVQHFKPRVCAAVEKGLANVSLERVTVDGAETSALVFRVVPGAGDLSVAKAIQIGRSKGLAVLATLPLTLLDATAERYVMLCKVSEIDMAARGTNLAVLSDPTPAVSAPVSAPAVAGTPKVEAVSPLAASVAPPLVSAPVSAPAAPESVTAESKKPPSAGPKRVKKARSKKDVEVSAPVEPLNGMNHKPLNAEKSEKVHELPVV